MKQNYFIYNGARYNSGTIIIIKWCSDVTHTVLNTRATFIDYNVESKEYTVEIYGKKYSYTKDKFFRVLCYVVNSDDKINGSGHVESKKCTFTDELNIDGVLIAWAWYVFIMVAGVIFYDRIGIWALASIVFFNYRNKKLKEAGYK